LFLALALVAVSFAATTSYSEPLCCEPEPVNPCDVVCDGSLASLDWTCDCPCWTDRRVEQTTCDRWYGVAGCFYL
jgi:hypothetical protein